MTSPHSDKIPPEFRQWIFFLCRVIPIRSILTFIELLIGALLSHNGFVTEAYSSIAMRNHWTSYYKWLQNGKWSWLALSRQFLRLLSSVLHEDVVHLAIDDTLTLRSSHKAPSSQIHHQHGNKPNLSQYVRGQCWVSLALIGKRRNGDAVALPLLSRLTPSAGNQGKLRAAKTLIRSIFSLLEHAKVRVLVDSWYMRQSFVEAMLARGFHVIGQARIDSRLYDLPAARKGSRKGRPRKYGVKWTTKRLAHVRKKQVSITLYGKAQPVRYYSKIVKARFINGREVRAVWAQLKNSQGEWKPLRLFLSTDTTLTAEQVLESYGLRWSIETLFNQLKLHWGLKEAWQQTRQTLHRWVHITMLGYGLLQLLTCIKSDDVEQLCQFSPWRTKNTITAGQIRKGLSRILLHVPVQSWLGATCQKIKVDRDALYNASDGKTRSAA